MEKSISPLFPGPQGNVIANDWCINNSNFQNIFQKIFFYISVVLKILWKMEHLLLRSKFSIFHNILKKSYISKASKGACVEWLIRTEISPTFFFNSFAEFLR